MKLPSPTSHHFSQVPGVKLGRSVFDRTCTHKTTFDSGLLIPVFLDDVLPGDTYNLRASFFARLATPLKPVMDNMYLESFFFFIPNRLVWNNWEKFCGAQDDPGDSTAFTMPQVEVPIGGSTVMELFDYFGIPSGAQITGAFNICALPSRCYNLVWNTWFRDENLQDSVVVDKDDGPDTYGDYVLLRRGKRHDYFTSALPWPQKGDAVTIPAGASSAPVERVSNAAKWKLYDAGTDNESVNNNILQDGTGGVSGLMVVGPNEYLSLDPNGGLIADLSSAWATTINELRLAFQTQALLERDARGGTRYVEVLKSHFGVTSPDFRLQRPEFLGGGSTPVTMHPVPLTAKGDGTTAGAQANLAAFGTAAARGHGFVKSFTEHGWILGLICVRADVTYQQGVPRMFLRSTRLDHYWPSLALIGEQVITNKEIYTQGTGDDADPFGYQERHAEYRYKPSLITGKFRSDYATPLDAWHLSQRFTALPVLDDTFIQETPPVSRVVVVASEPEFMMDSYFDLKCVRPMPVFGIPGLGSRF